MRNFKDAIKNETAAVQKEIREKVVGYIVAAFGLVAGLAWNDAIKGFIEYLFPLSKDTVVAKFFYAVIITFIVVIASVYLSRLLQENHPEKK